jgi:hypothetical protein
MSDVQVINRNTFPLKGRFAAIDYVFPPNEPVEIPERAAAHIFGWDEDDRSPQKAGALNRLGLLKQGDKLEDALAVLGRCEFHTGRTVFERPTEIGDTPGAPRNPGGESGLKADVAPAESPDDLAREVLARRAKRPSGG